ncbi:Polygalacturonase [Nymphaea thermarum]|nr:Polygalacturonase [Nymphaea thermarum]
MANSIAAFLTTLCGLFALAFLRPASAAYVITSYGAKPDGVSDSSRAFLKAWNAACNSAGPSTVYVPVGRFLLLPVEFSGPCRSRSITVRIDGTLVASAYYWRHSTAGHWLLFDSVEGVTIEGGTLDGRGSALWACKAAAGNCPDGATSLYFNNAKDVAVKGLASINSELFHIVFLGCVGVNVERVAISAAGDSPNTDGIHVERSSRVSITNTRIQTGDDCISIGPGAQNLWIEQVACGPGHGISIGSLGREATEDGVQNITVKNTVFKGSQNGLRIKTWARKSTGFVRGVVFQTATMQNVINPIIIDQNYCPHNNNCPNQHSGVRISGVTYSNIKGSSATPVAVKFACSPAAPCKAIRLADVKLMYQQQPTKSSCQNVAGTASGLVVPPSCF